MMWVVLVRYLLLSRSAAIRLAAAELLRPESLAHRKVQAARNNGLGTLESQALYQAVKFHVSRTQQRLPEHCRRVSLQGYSLIMQLN